MAEENQVMEAPAAGVEEQPKTEEAPKEAAEEKPVKNSAEKTEEKPKEEKPVKQEKPVERRERPKSRAGDDTVFVGQKPTMSYVLAAITQFSDGIKEVHIKARGRSISRAVDVAEVVRNKFMTDVTTKVDIGTEQISGERGKLNVSTIDIALSK